MSELLKYYHYWEWDNSESYFRPACLRCHCFSCSVWPLVHGFQNVKAKLYRI